MSKKSPPKPQKQKRLISDEVALISGDIDESDRKFKISFDHYRGDLCEIDELEISPARKCLTKIKQLGQSNRQTLRENNIQPKRVSNTGHYKKLFSKLSEDVEIFEIDIGAASRLFYFIVNNLLHVVLIKNSHFKY